LLNDFLVLSQDDRSLYEPPHVSKLDSVLAHPQFELSNAAYLSTVLPIDEQLGPGTNLDDQDTGVWTRLNRRIDDRCWRGLGY